jgi:hypothetical protein
MLTLPVLCLSLLAQPKPQPLDISAMKATLVVLTDGKQHYLVANGAAAYNSPLLYGDGKSFVQVPVKGGGSSGTESWDVYFWEPRVLRLEQHNSSVEMKDSGAIYQVDCGPHTTTLKALPAAEAKAMMEKATVTTRSWLRLPDRLLRDDKGTYYLIDRLRTEDAGDRRDFRLFIGPRGKMKLMSLKDVVDDSAGMIFATPSGELRLVVGSAEGRPNQAWKWVEHGKEQALVDVPLDDNRNVAMVYQDLGPYSGQRLGTPCDDLL